MASAERAGGSSPSFSQDQTLVPKHVWAQIEFDDEPQAPPDAYDGMPPPRVNPEGSDLFAGGGSKRNRTTASMSSVGARHARSPRGAGRLLRRARGSRMRLPRPLPAASDDMRLLASAAADDITAVFSSMELLQILSPQPIGASAQGSFGGGSSRAASFSAIQEQGSPESAGSPDPTAPFTLPVREAVEGFGVPVDILNSDSLRRLSANSAASCAQPSAASGPQLSAASCVSVPAASPSPGSAASSSPQLPLSPSDHPALTPEEVRALLDSGHIGAGLVGSVPPDGADGAGDGSATGPADRDRRDWYALIQTMSALSSRLAVLGPSMRDKRAALVLFYQDALPRLAGLGPVGQLAQHRLAVMMAEVGLAHNPRRPPAETAPIDELASGLSSGGLSGANALVGLPDEDGFLEIVGQGLSAVQRYASSAIVAPASERRSCSSAAMPPPPTWFGAGPPNGLPTATPGSPELGAASLSGENRPKLHACKNCQRAKTACMDQRPCARCVRLCLTCDDDHKTVRRACANCKRAKVRCNLGDGHPCARCIRLHMDCTEHAKSKRTRAGAGGGSGDEEVSSPVRDTPVVDGYALPPLSVASSTSLSGMASYPESGAAGGAAVPGRSLGGGLLYSVSGGGDMPMGELQGAGPSVGFIFGDLVQAVTGIGAGGRDAGAGNGVATYTPRVE